MNISTHLNNAPSIKMKDSLSQVLGAITDGIIDYSFLDCVKLAGHSCPTVASTFLMTKLGLEVLYKNEIPQRGNIKVYFKANKSEGTTGVMGNVVSFITGASDEGGFKGLAGKHNRNNKISYNNSDLSGVFSLERIDTEEKVQLNLNLSTLPTPPKMGMLMEKMMGGSATDEEIKEFGDLWQQKVKNLLDHSDQYIFTV